MISSLSALMDLLIALLILKTFKATHVVLTLLVFLLTLKIEN